MKEFGPIFRHYSKDEIMNKARTGVFNRNPKLTTPHELVCETCRYTQKITYLDHLKSGNFELGETKLVEVALAAPTISGLSSIRERITPIMIKVRCERCKSEISCSPISLEYLLFSARKPQKGGHLYV